MMSDGTDINEVFENLLFAEENCIKEAYRDGLEVGKSRDNIEGFHLGYHRGAEIGAELGFYYSITNYYLGKDYIADKAKVELISLKKEIDEFPKSNVDDVDIIGMLTKIQLQYKKACAILKIPINYLEKDNLTF